MLRNYACLQVLVNIALTWQSSCVIANNDVTEKQFFMATVIISHASQVFV